MSRDSSKAVMRIYNGEQKLNDISLAKLFLKQLDSVYCIKKHLLKVLPPMAEEAVFPDLKAAILDSADQIKVQLLRMDVIYKMYSTEYTEDKCIGIKTLSLEAYIASKATEQHPLERDLALLLHLQIIESVEMAYFEVLKRLAANMHNSEVEVLLVQNFQTATRSKHLYELIAKEYIL